jgi:8-amino-3,8-dideoxy-alpha-D-manno-octulosonate transaminase
LSRFNFSGRVALYSYGEPCTDDRLPDLVRYAREKLPKANIEINSNGFLLTLNLYKKLVDSGISCIYVSQYGKSMPKTIKEIFEYLKTRPKGENKISYRIFNEELYPLISNRGGEIEVAENVNYERPICGYPNHAQTIDYQGNWVLCCNDYHSSIKFGNLEKESILQVWNKPYFKKIRKETNNGVYNLEICKKCVGIVKPKKENLVSISN